MEDQLDHQLFSVRDKIIKTLATLMYVDYQYLTITYIVCTGMEPSSL